MHNLAVQSDLDKTARTDPLCARMRYENLTKLFPSQVRFAIELCVGPSLKTISEEAARFDIEVHGNDLDPKWEGYFPKGLWHIGDAFEVGKQAAKDGLDTVIFAPPVSKGCTGKREDSLMIEEVTPSYSTFLKEVAPLFQYVVIVLPGRSNRTKPDREQFYKLVNQVYEMERQVAILPLRSKRNLQKYVDIYIGGRIEA